MNGPAFILIAIVTLAAALAAATLRELMHAALSFAVALVGIAAFFFLLGAEFVGLALVFIYIGAVAVLIVFTILLTRRGVGKDSRIQLGRRDRRCRCVRRLDLVDSKDTIACHRRPAHAETHSKTNWRNLDDYLCLAIAMRRAFADCRVNWRAYSRAGGKTVRKMKQTPNPQGSTFNSQFGRNRKLDVGGWTLGVGRFLVGPQ